MVTDIKYFVVGASFSASCSIHGGYDLNDPKIREIFCL